MATDPRTRLMPFAVLLVVAGACGQSGSPTGQFEESAHNSGATCRSCHAGFDVGGTVWTSRAAVQPAPGTPVLLTSPEGGQLALAPADESGNFHSTLVDAGEYLVRVGARTSRTWHGIPARGDCNSCHVPDGGATAGGDRSMHDLHTALPAGNDCTHCHHFPATMSIDRLRSPGALSAMEPAPRAPGSMVRIRGMAYAFDPSPGSVVSVRPDIFAPGHFSMFDAILAVAAREGITVRYHFDADRQTHFIDEVDSVPGDYWYHFSYDAGPGNQTEIGYRRAYRWDEALWRHGVWVELVQGEDLDEIKAEYLEEIERERTYGHVIPEVTIALNPSNYQGNPPASHRVTVSRRFSDVRVDSHGLRSTGYPSPYSKPFQPGVVTSLDILLSLRDQGRLDLVTSVFYDRFAGHYIDSYYVVGMGFPGVGTAHASGRHGFVYVTGNGTRQRMPNNADRKFHMTSDIAVVHAPDFSSWRWIELGNPWYEADPGLAVALERSVAEDYDALARGASLHTPVTRVDGTVGVSWVVFEPGRVRITVQDTAGRTIATLRDRSETNLGRHGLAWLPPPGIPDRALLVLEHGLHRQIRDLRAAATVRPDH